MEGPDGVALPVPHYDRHKNQIHSAAESRRGIMSGHFGGGRSRGSLPVEDGAGENAAPQSSTVFMGFPQHCF